MSRQIYMLGVFYNGYFWTSRLVNFMMKYIEELRRWIKMQRCQWIEGKPEYYVNYHDHVWGRPEHKDQMLFQWLSLEIMHIGLSFQLVLSKKEAFMKAFDNFDIDKVAQFTEKDVTNLMSNPEIIRHQRKIEAIICNAQMIQKLQNQWGSFAAYLWHFTNNTSIDAMDDDSACIDLSQRITKDMKRNGFKFIGSTTIKSYLEGIGIIDGHEFNCDFKH